MRIIFDHQIFGWQEYGGISRYIYELAANLSGRHSQDVSIVSPLYVNRYLASAPSSLNVVGMRVPPMPKTGLIRRTVNSVLSRPAMMLRSPDIVHETYYSAKRIAPKRAKVVLTVYDMIHERFSDQFLSNDPTSREKALAVGRADHVICISEQTRSDLIEMLGVNPSKTSVVHLGFTLTAPQQSVTQNELSQRPYLLYVGLRGGYKNFEGFVRAYASSAALMEGFSLLCFGGGVITSKEQELFRYLGVPADLIRHVSGSDELLAKCYRSASAFIYPSLYEGFGIPPLEAMCFDCPVVCSNVSSIPEVVGEAAEMFNPYDHESIRFAIERVVGDGQRRGELVAQGRERLKKFSWDRCASETLDIYRQVIA